MSEKMSIKVAKLMDNVLELEHSEQEALFMLVGVVLSERDPERLSQLLYTHIAKEVFTENQDKEGIFHIFALTMNLTLDKIARRVKLEACATEETAEPLLGMFGVWNSSALNTQEN